MDVTNKSHHHTIILIDSLNRRHGMKGRMSYGPCDASCGHLTFCLNVEKDTTEDHRVVPLLSQVALVHTFNAYGRPGKVYGIVLLEEVYL
jgi:hypothetical protein